MSKKPDKESKVRKRKRERERERERERDVLLPKVFESKGVSKKVLS